jgi:release factor glutamine methyltransferase
MLIRELLKLSQLLVGSDSATLDAELLLCHCLAKERAYLYTWPEREVDAQQENHFRELIARRQRGEPVAYLLGSRDFWSFSLAVDNSTLIPRPDTERLVEVALELLSSDRAKVLDLGTGTGAIALALAKEKPHWQVLGIDVANEAVDLAQRNARALEIINAEFVQSDWFANIPAQQFDLIVSNPPYIDGADPHLAQGDVRFEPRRALVAEQSGLAAIAEITARAQDYLKSGAWLLFEHGFEQAPLVRTLLSQQAFESIATWNDFGGRERVTGGRWREKNVSQQK